MKKDYSNKAINKSVNDKKFPKELICIQECEVPGVGYFKRGDTVKNKDNVALLINNVLYFKRKEEHKK